MASRIFTFIGSDSGAWNIDHMETIIGEAIPHAKKLDRVDGLTVTSTLPTYTSTLNSTPTSSFSLHGILSNERYVERSEKEKLIPVSPDLGRRDSTLAVLIPIRKNASWWDLTQDERRKIFEVQSHHIQIGMKALPAIARKLHHCRDLSENEPFDFLTWFEFAPQDEKAFDQMLAELRATEEWKYVDREVEIRLSR